MVYDFISSCTREADLVEEGAGRHRKHVRTAARHERLGGEDTLVWPVGPTLLRVAEMARVTVLPFRAPSRWLLKCFGSWVMRRTIQLVGATIA